MDKIGLIDVDGHNFPNLALMKISAYHKSKGDIVEWYDPLFDNFDKVYQSKIFSFTTDYKYKPKGKLIKGGIAYGLENKLPKEIEHSFPDYSIYGDKYKNTSYGFLTRGCPRGCKFCNVAEHQGKVSRKVANLSEFWDKQKKIVLLDPNILACKDWEILFKQLEESKAHIDFSQGLDIRLMTKKKAAAIEKLKINMIHFAWDNYEFKTYEKLKEFKKWTTLNERKLRVYVLVNFNTTIEQDLDRIYKLRKLGYDPYVMVFEKEKLKKDHEIRKIQRWVNAKPIWRTCKRFEDYKKNKSNNYSSNLKIF